MKLASMFLIAAVVAFSGQVAGAHDGHDHGDGKSDLTKRDQLRIAVQAICPMSGEKLGEHGAPIKVKMGEEVVFVCCQGCLKDKVDATHWATIHANFAKAQKICPIMKKELPKNPKWTIVEGQIVYVCCPPCTKKIQKDPKTHLAKLDELYTASIKAKTASK